MQTDNFRFNYIDLLDKAIETMVSSALEEDLSLSTKFKDITAELVPTNTKANARLITREAGILCGQRWFNACFKRLDPDIQINWLKADADPFDANTVLCTLSGDARAILTAERSALNFLQTLSATASKTANYVEQLEGLNCRLLDTRKTIPGFRLAQKYAVLCGGGHNHRIGLFDAYLIKENHIRACGGISPAVTKARALNPGAPIEVEVENLDELNQALKACVDIIMLDNFSNADKRKAVTITAGSAALEASGNVTLQTIRAIAETGVDYISVGAITKNINAIDLSLLIED